jgi:hypothetical protein
MTTDQIMEYLRAEKNPTQENQNAGSIADRKCGFGIKAQVQQMWAEFNKIQQKELKFLMQAPSLPCDTIAGHFRIFYDTSSSNMNTPALLDQYNNRIPGTAKAYVDSAARIFNHVWDVEIDQMGYTAPPSESPDSYYYVYILSMTDYGATTPTTQIAGSNNPARYYSYIEVNNDFRTLPTKGINGLKVTAAHEFHHAIQIGSYGYWGSELYAHELTSTWLEDVVYPEVNDYFFYLPSYFNGFYQGLSFNTNSGGYERVIWPIFLVKKFNQNIMLDIWTRMRAQPFLESTDGSLMSRGSNLQSAFAEFTYWNYYTADRANPQNYYPEGAYYPRYTPFQKAHFSETDVTLGGDVQPLSSSMYEFEIASDTLTAIIANVDIQAAEIGQTLTERVDIVLSHQVLFPPYHQLGNGLNAKILTVDSLFWRGFFSQTSSIIYISKRYSQCAPNPFRLNYDQQLLLPIKEDEGGVTQVFFYSSSLSLEYSSEIQVSYQNESKVIAVPSVDLRSKLSTGIYFIAVKTKKNTYQWKVAVIR